MGINGVHILTSTQQKEVMLNHQLNELDANYPSLNFVPNIGQERAFSFYKTLDTSPYIMLFGGGNGVGKTADMVIMAVGLIFGPDYLNEFFDKYKVFEEYQELLKNRNRQGVIRLLVNADSMREGGSVYQAITEWFPKGDDPKKPLYKLMKGGKNHYSIIKINVEGAPIVEIKTHDQDVAAHSGTTVDWTLCDEPFPQHLWGEMLGRTRDGGRIAMFLTPLNMAGWLMDDVVDDIDGVNKCMTNASIWDNCKDIPGTRGHLTRENIEKMIREWRIASPNEVSARENGTFTHLSGSIYKVFTKRIHLCKPFDIPTNWPIYNIIDPHDSKCPFLLWILQGPNNRHWVIDEWPRTDFTKMGNTDLTIEKVVQIIREIERPIIGQIVKRIMDPNKGTFVYSDSKKTIQTLWREAGLRYDLCTNDDLDYGHKAVNRLLYYDQQKPVESGFNQPSAMIFDHCENMAKSVARYGLKKNHTPGASLTANIDQKYKDPADCLRYYSVDMRDFQDVAERNSFMNQIMGGRIKIKYK